MRSKREPIYYAFYSIEDFERACVTQFEFLRPYNFYFTGEPYKVKDINHAIGSKPTFYNHRVNLYYDENRTVFLTIYTKDRIYSEVLILENTEDFKVTSYVYGLAKRLKKLCKE